MKFRTLFPLFFALSTIACSATTVNGHGPTPTWGFQMRDVKFPMRDFRFPSGLRVLVEEDHRMPLVSVTSIVGVGSTADPPGKEGLAHYVEHLTFRARPDGKVSVESLLTQAGAGAHNASTHFDHTMYYSEGPREALSGLLAIEAQRLLGPLDNVPAPVAAIEKEVVRNELRLRGETGYVGAVYGAMQEAVFPESHPYHRSAIGTHGSLTAITTDDARAFVKQNYRPENATIVIVGDVSLAEVGAVVEEAIPKELRAGVGGKHPAPRMPANGAPPPEPSSPKLARKEANLPTPQLWIGWSLPRGFDADSILLDAVVRTAQTALIGAFREDQDISNVRVTLQDGKEASMMLAAVHLRAANHPERSLDHALNQMVKLWQLQPEGAGRGIGAQASELSFGLFRRVVVTSMLSDSEDLLLRGEQRALGTHFADDPLVFSRKLRAAMDLPVDAVASLASKYLTRDRARAVLFTPSAVDPGGTNQGVAADPDPEPLPPAPDAETMKAFTRPLGVTSYRSEVLDNGLYLIVGNRPGLPVATVQAAFRGGEGDDLGAEMLADYLAEPVVTTSVRPSQFGARFRQYATLDDYQYSMTGSSGNVVDMVALLGEWVRGMKVRDETAQGFFRDSLKAVQVAEKWPEAQANRAFYALLYPEHVYGRTPVAADLEKLSSGKINDWIGASHVGNNGMVVVVGEIADTQAVHDAVVAAFGGMPAGVQREIPAPPAIPQGAAAKPTFKLIPREGATQLEIRFGCTVPPPNGSLAQLDVAGALLGARLNDRLRRRIGASYGFGARAVPLRGGATHIQGGGSIENAHAAKAMEEIRDALKDLSSGSAPAADLDRARWSRALAYAVSYPSVEDIASRILQTGTLGTRLTSIDEYPKKVLTVSADDVQTLFRACAATPVIVAVGAPSEGEKAFAAAWP